MRRLGGGTRVQIKTLNQLDYPIAHKHVLLSPHQLPPVKYNPTLLPQELWMQGMSSI
jgi:hypothetical protein